MVDPNQAEVFEDNPNPPAFNFYISIFKSSKDLISFNEIFAENVFYDDPKSRKESGLHLPLEDWSHPQGYFMYWVCHQCTEWSLNTQEIFTYISLSFLLIFLKQVNQVVLSEL